MSQHVAFKRQPVPQQFAQAQKTITIPAPTRGIVWSENEAFMPPGCAIVQDNWMPTMRGVKLRGGTIRYCDLHALDTTATLAWANLTSYAIGDIRRDTADNTTWKSNNAHLSGAGPLTFAQFRTANPLVWSSSLPTPLPGADPLRLPVISAFEYISGNTQRMFAAQATKLFDVTSNTPVLVKSGLTSGNFVASQLANLSGYYMLVCNETGDAVMRFDGTTWVTYTTELTAGPVPGTATHLSYVAKYRNRYFFIETQSMNMWYLPIDSIQGAMTKIPLSGAASKGGVLKFLAVWSIDAGDGIDDKLAAVTSEGEVLIFSGSNPADPNNWRQEGRYAISPPLGMNAHISVGGDLLIATVDGIIPISAAITKDSGQLELAAITRPIKPLWREDVIAKAGESWSLKKWDEFGGLFVSSPGGLPGKTHCWGANNATGAWCTFSWDARCFIRMRADMFYGDQRGIIMQCERTGMDDGNAPSPIDRKSYLALLVGGWEMFNARSQQVIWHQARAVFTAEQGEPFQPQINATTDFVVVIPPPPPPGPDPGIQDVWDQGKWGPANATVPPSAGDITAYAQWDQPSVQRPVARNTMWVSIGMMGFSHAPIIQVTVAQQAKPNVELIAVAATFEQAGVTV